MPPRKMPFADVMFSFEGRLGRSDCWRRGMLPLAAMSSVAELVVGSRVGPLAAAVVVFFFFLWPYAAVGAKRCHDRDLSGWFQLIALIPIVGAIWLFIECGILKGTEGDNRFGPDPMR